MVAEDLILLCYEYLWLPGEPQGGLLTMMQAEDINIWMWLSEVLLPPGSCLGEGVRWMPCSPMPAALAGNLICSWNKALVWGLGLHCLKEVIFPGAVEPVLRRCTREEF